MKILYHHRTLGDGAEGIHIREIVSALRGLGHEVRLVALVGEDGAARPAPTSQSRWKRVSRLLPGHAYELAELGYNLVAARKIRRAIREFQPDVVYDRYNSYSTAALTEAKRAGLPALLEVNAPVAFERGKYTESLPIKFPRLAVRYERRILAMADRIFAVSTPLRDFLVEERDVPSERVIVLPNGANPTLFDPSTSGDPVRKRFGLEGCFTIGFVGILRPWHGMDLLLESFTETLERAPQARLLIVGDGPMEEPLREQARKNGIEDRVVFAGRVPHQEMASYVAAMNLAVSPRATFYASPMKILEYMAMGVPTVAPRMPNIEDILKDGEDSALFEPESRESLTQALLSFIEDEERCREAGRRARKNVEEHLNWERNAQVVVDTAAEIARAAGAPTTA